MPAQTPQRARIALARITRRYATPLRLAYLACIAIATLLHLDADPSLANAYVRLQRALAPHIGFRDVIDAARNVALFLGWGATCVLTSDAPATRRGVLVATVTGMLASIAVESLQLFSPFRTASIVDVATNTLGSLLGAMTVWLVEARATGDMRRGTMIGVPGWLPAGSLLLMSFGLAFAPSTRASRIVAWAASPLERARVVAGTAAVEVPWAALTTDAVAWLVVGLAVAVAIDDRAGRIRIGQFAAWLMIVPGLLFIAHAGRAMAGLQREAGSAMVQSVAVAFGLVLGLLLVPRWRATVTARSTRALQLGLLTAAVGAMISWSPATWAVRAGGGGFSWRQLVPMMSLFQRQDLSSVFLVLQKAGLGAAVGACLAARTRVGEPRPGIRIAAAYAAAIELGQFLVPGRFPDMTDAMITLAAACLVAVLVERAAREVTSGDALERPALNGHR